MKQLKLTEETLLQIGFVKKEYEAVEPTEDEPFGSVSKKTYQMPTINGFFQYNCDEYVYVWYHKTLVGGAANFVLLDITHKANLFTVLSAFRAKFNLVIKD